MNTQKYIFSFILLVFGMFTGELKAEDNSCELPIMVRVSDKSALATENAEMLKSKLERIVTQAGFGGTELSHLCLEASVTPVDRELLSGTRPLVTTTVEVTLLMYNVMGGEKFGSTTIELKGVGKTENIAVKGALTSFNPSDDRYQKFLERCHSKVMDYYRSNIPSIIRQSEFLSNRGEYEKSLYLLSTVPPCVAGYDEIGERMLAVWQEYLDQDCAEKIAKAKAVWHSSQTEEAAKEAAAYLAAIDRKSGCVEEADKLMDEISSKISENINRLLQQEEDSRAFEKESARAEIELRKQQIEAIRQLSLAYGQNIIKSDDKDNLPLQENDNNKNNSEEE